MKISLRWLSRYVDLEDKTPEAILADLTMSTAEVEGIEAFAPPLPQVVIGRVVAREKHSGADKLSVTKVDVGQGEPLQIVCGAHNVAAGQHVIVALPGARLPNGLEIRQAKIRGVDSSGMICSESELGIAEHSSGILVVDGEPKPGRPYADVLGISDHVLEIDNKSINHRPDLWGHYGIARELSAIWGRPLRRLPAAVELPRAGVGVAIEIEDRAACPRYLGIVIDGVRASPSPNALRWALLSVGQRSIDLLVDLTNFVMLDLGQPLHAFDFDKLKGASVGVRFATAGERLVTLDGVERRLEPRDLLITAADRPIALAGVMGGESTMVDADTKRVLLESANFHAATIRRTSTRLGLRSDASARFEKSLDPHNTVTALNRFIGLLREHCPTAKAAGPIADPTKWSFAPRSVRLRKARLDLKLGVTLPSEQVGDILRRLHFDVQPVADGFAVGVPSFRATKDISIEDDLIEEVGRMFRYDNIREVPLRSMVAVPEREPELWLLRTLCNLAATELGAHEVYDYSFVPDAVLSAAGADDAAYLRVTNPVAPESTRMRRHVLPSLLAALPQNLRRGREVRLFEEGKGYWPEQRDEHGLPHEVRELCFAFARKDGEHPYAELRLGIESLLARTGRPVAMDRCCPIVPNWLHPSRHAQMERGGRGVGFVGHVNPKVARAFGIDAQVAIANIDIRALLSSDASDGRYRPISTFPPQPVDVALLVPVEQMVGVVAEFLHAMGKEEGTDLVQDVKLFEVYLGEGVPAGQKSLNFTVTLGAMDRTLSSKDEERYLGRVRARCAEIGANLRG